MREMIALQEFDTLGNVEPRMPLTGEIHDSLDRRGFGFQLFRDAPAPRPAYGNGNWNMVIACVCWGT